MKRPRVSLLGGSFLAAVLLSPVIVAVASPPRARPTGPATPAAVSGDPDMPLGIEVDEYAYRVARDNEIGRLRGLPSLRRHGSALRTQAVAATRAAKVRTGPVATMADAADAIGVPSIPQWTASGPAPIPNGQIQNAVGSPPGAIPVTGRVTSIAIAPDHTTYIGMAQGGVWRTKDEGASWTPLFDAQSTLTIGALTLAPSDPNLLYVGTGEANFAADSDSGNGLYRIENAAGALPVVIGPINPAAAGGFNGALNAFDGRSISKIVVDPLNAARIVVATTQGVGGTRSGAPVQRAVRGLYSSVNATAALASVSVAPVAIQLLSNLPVADLALLGDGTTLLASVYDSSGSSGGIYRTADIWAATPVFTKPLAVGAGVRIAMDVASSTLYAATGEVSGALRQSVDQGVTWTLVTGGSPGFCGGQCWYDIAVATHNGTILLGGSAHSTALSTAHAVTRSTNAGLTFTDVGEDVHADTHAIAYSSDGLLVWLGNDGGIFLSKDDGQSWTSKNGGGLSGTQFMSVAASALDPQLYIGGTQDNGTPMHTGAGWTRADYGDGGDTLIDSTDGTMYHTYFNQQNNLLGFAAVATPALTGDGAWPFYGCVDGVTTNNGIACTDPVNFYAPLALGPGGPGSPNTVYFGSNKLYRSPNKGVTATAVSQALATPISSIAISPQNDSVRLVGLNNGSVWSTTSGSATLTDITSGLPVATATTSPTVGSVAIDPTDSTVGYVAFNNYFGGPTSHVWRTSNLAAGGSWTAAGAGLPDAPVNALTFDPADHTKMFAGTDVGVFQSIDSGTTWTPFTTGMPSVAVFDLAVSSGGGLEVLRAATHGRGMYETTIQKMPQAITFNAIGAKVFGALPFAVAATSSSALPVTISKATGVTACSIAANVVTILTSGACTLTATQAGNAIYAAATPVTRSFAVSPATDIQPKFTGTPFAFGATTAATTAKVTLKTTVTDTAGGGDVRKAKVTFVNRDTHANVAGCVNLAVTLVSSLNPKVGSATCSPSLAIGSVSTSPVIGTVLSGSYSRNMRYDDVVVTVARPFSTLLLTGGGTLNMAASTGLISGTPGSRNEWGFALRYNAARTSLVGTVTALVRHAGHIYLIRGTTPTGLVLAAPNARYSGRATVTDITSTPVVKDSTANFRLAMTNGSRDQLSIDVRKSSGTYWFASRTVGGVTTKQSIATGSLTVR
jgi:hypothetical protein